MKFGTPGIVTFVISDIKSLFKPPGKKGVFIFSETLYSYISTFKSTYWYSMMYTADQCAQTITKHTHGEHRLYNSIIIDKQITPFFSFPSPFALHASSLPLLSFWFLFLSPFVLLSAVFLQEIAGCHDLLKPFHTALEQRWES